MVLLWIWRINKTWSLKAGLHPAIPATFDEAVMLDNYLPSSFPSFLVPLWTVRTHEWLPNNVLILPHGHGRPHCPYSYFEIGSTARGLQRPLAHNASETPSGDVFRTPPGCMPTPHGRERHYEKMGGRMMAAPHGVSKSPSQSLASDWPWSPTFKDPKNSCTCQKSIAWQVHFVADVPHVVVPFVSADRPTVTSLKAPCCRNKCFRCQWDWSQKFKTVGQHHNAQMNHIAPNLQPTTRS